MVPLSHDYKNKDGSLNTSSNLVSTVNCVKGGGTTAYANAIDAAQAELQKDGRPRVPDVIVFLSDGAANTGPSYYATTRVPHPALSPGRHLGEQREGGGDDLYTIGYALGDDTGGCNSDTGPRREARDHRLPGDAGHAPARPATSTTSRRRASSTRSTPRSHPTSGTALRR